MLASYSWGQPARRLAALDHPGAQDVVLRHLSRVHPQLREPQMIRDSRAGAGTTIRCHRWRLRVVHARPAHRVPRRPVAPEGRIYFAGEHASLTHTWMQGALESGLRATREILTASQRTY